MIILQINQTQADGAGWRAGGPGHNVVVPGRADTASGPRRDKDGRKDKRVGASANPSCTTPAHVEVVLARALAVTDAGPRKSEGQEGDGKEVWDGLAPSGKEAEEHRKLKGHGVGAARGFRADAAQHR